MSTAGNVNQPDVSPLGPGHAPEKDPMKGIRGVMAGTLFLEAITILLILTVILKVNDGVYWTTFNWVFITAIGLAHIAAAFVQRFPWSLGLNLALQAILLVGGFFVHYSAVLVAVIFIIVWWYLMHLRSTLMERMKRGWLTTQHM